MNKKEAKKLDKILNHLSLNHGWYDKNQLTKSLRIEISDSDVLTLKTKKFSDQPIVASEFFQSAAESYRLTDYEVVFLKNGGFTKGVTELRSKRIFSNFQRAAIIISIPASIIAIILGIRSCNKESEVKELENRIEKLKKKI